MRQIIFTICSCILLSSCFKEDKLLPSTVVYDKIGQVDMGSEPAKDYLQQLYYDLSSNKVVKQNQRDAWDLALGCDPGNPNLFVNQAMSMSVARTASHNFDAEYHPDNYVFRNERVGSFYKKGLMGSDFKEGNSVGGEVFIINLGTNINSRARGYKLLKILSWQSGKYVLKISDLDHSNEQEVEVSTDDTYNYVFLSFQKPGEILALEPPKGSWDLIFTKYMERLYDGNDTLDYSVTGCLLNPYFTEAGLYRAENGEDIKLYNDLLLEDMPGDLLSNRSDAIGYDWKYYDIEAAKYTIFDDMLYFIKDSEDVIYKMHFTGFLGNDGRKGVISFAYLPL